jgi:hypothetical protein
MTTLTIPAHDKGYLITFTVTQDDGVTAKDISAYTITLKAWIVGTPATTTVSGACSILVGPSGTCTYTLGAADFLTPGRYQAELQLTSAGVIESTQYFSINVVESAT